MNTAIRFLQVQPRRAYDSPNMKLWACIVDGVIIAYTDEPETLMNDEPRNNHLETGVHRLMIKEGHELCSL